MKKPPRNFSISISDKKPNLPVSRAGSLGGIIIFLLGFSTALCSWLYALEQWGSSPVPSAIWNDALIDTKTTIAHQHEHPKLLIVSGSSAIAGINAQQMDKALGINCVNFGSSAGFGLNFILWASQPALNSGDAVILPLEYEHYNFKTHENVDVTLLHVIASERKVYFDTLPWLDAFRLKLGYSYGYIYKSLFTKYNPMMPIENWGKPICNKWGDIVTEEKTQTPAQLAKVKNQRSQILTEGISDETESWDILRAYVTWCRERDITVLATWPNICYWKDYEIHESI